MFQSQHVIDSLKPESVSEFRGKLNFSIAFEKEISTLHVHLLEAVDLPVKDITGNFFCLILVILKLANEMKRDEMEINK
ncbi:unnamed protein product [Cylicostephanus goldi]|uniref:Uncharacterized protein n=1 Tax=Cylicostephanus goldi TaxID=71465 RepID=A0A3P6SWY4_CYLGO|nr:unnamed protein product [Cylicostephanus goldi]